MASQHQRRQGSGLGGGGGRDLTLNNTNRHQNNGELKIFFVHVGQDMPKRRIALLSSRAQEKGATVLTEFQSPFPLAPLLPRKRRKQAWWVKPSSTTNTTTTNNENNIGGSSQQQQQQRQQQENQSLPTHLVIGEDCSTQQVVEKLQFASVHQFEKYVRNNGIKCAIPPWITHTTEDRLCGDLKLHERWWKLSAESSESRTNEKNKSSNAATSSSRRISQQPPDDDEDDDIAPNNDALADALKDLGKLHQKCPINDDDTWKAYALNKISGRIRHLDFQVTLERESQQRLKDMHGIGERTIEKINQFLQHGQIVRTKEFLRDPDRMAMKVMVGIWGVGRKTALSLIKRGYRNIEDVRKDVAANKLQLDRNQLIGVECHEDFLEQMSRDEAEAIGKILKAAIVAEFPGQEDKLEVTIMGSYRRGAPACGDVDVLVTHRDHIETVPPQLLGEVVEKLLDAGRMAYHLTLISGMKVRRQDDFHAGGYNDDTFSPTKEKQDNYSGSSYMGVFHSPTIPGKKRRVDIKFYPYRSRAFCWLYFTGNGFFNRSMRLYATRQHGLLLNDRGLYERGLYLHGQGQGGKKSVLDASEEKEVFRFLGLQYKEPNERDCFSAVVGNSADAANEDDDKISAAERNEEWDHQWIE